MSVSPPSKKRQEFLALLAQCTELATGMNAMLEASMPSSRTPTHEDLSKLTIEERLAMGNNIISELKQVAFEVNPSFTIDVLEGELAGDELSKAEATRILTRVGKQ